MRIALTIALLFPMNAERPIQHPELLERAARTESFTLGRPSGIRVLGDRVLFLRAERGSRQTDIWSMDMSTGEERVLLSAEELLGGGEEQVSAEEQARRERARIRTSGFTGFAVTGSRLVAKLSGDLYLYQLDSGDWARLILPSGVVLDPRLSPDGKRLAFVLENDLHVAKLPRPKGSGKAIELEPRPLTEGGTDDQPNGLAEFVAQEEMQRMEGYWWSPDSKRIAYQSNDSRDVETFTIADAGHPERPAATFPYPRPGKANVDVRLFVTDRKGKKRVEVKWDREAFPYLARVEWASDDQLSLLVQDRAQEHQRLLLADEDGDCLQVFEERDDAWLNLRQGTPRWLSDGRHYLYATEAAGAWSLELHTARPGEAPERVVVVPPDAGYDELVAVDELRGRVWFTGGTNPVETHLFWAPLSGGGPIQQVTSVPGDHSVSFGPDRRRLAVTRVTLSDLPVTEVYALETDGSLGEGRMVTSVAEEPTMLPDVELVEPERAGGYHAAIVRPRDFEAGRRYPVVVYVYGGPHVNIVRAAANRYFLHQFIADQGFVVVSIDNRGTPRRGRAWERSVSGRFGSVPLEGQVEGLKALGRSFGEMDMSRVGVYGWSFGGTMAALSVLDRPDVYKAAVSGAPVTNWLYYDTHYTERYLGVPTTDAAAYDEGNLVRRAPQLSRPLLLIHGIADDNVYLAHSLLLTEALFAAGKPFEFLPLVNSTHQLADPEMRMVLYTKIARFFQEHL